MNKQIKFFIAFVAVVVVLGGALGWVIFKKSPAANPTTDTILFYGRECPHCQDVEKFLSENKIAEKVQFDSVEVWHNPDNAKLMMQKVKACGLAEEAAGVPFLFSAGKCFIGAPDVEGFFKEKAGL